LDAASMVSPGVIFIAASPSMSLTPVDYIVPRKKPARCKAGAVVDEFGGFVSHFHYP
jgi:hypothetical protein